MEEGRPGRVQWSCNVRSEKVSSNVGVARFIGRAWLVHNFRGARADADPLFTRPQVAKLVHSYLASADAKQPLASPLHGRLAGMPPVRIHVGYDEVLLDDSLQYVEGAVAAGVDAQVDVWIEMPHGFVGSIGRLKAAARALDAIGAFLAERLQAHASS